LEMLTNLSWLAAQAEINLLFPTFWNKEVLPKSSIPCNMMFYHYGWKYKANPEQSTTI
jgi:hypothetical protein